MLIALAAAVAASLAASAVAEHEVYYRFTVLGYVKDDRGKPIADATVEVVRDKTGLTYAGLTDVDGFYAVRARLGDESQGERLTVRRGTSVRHVTVAFDPDNHTEERGTRVDFQGTRAVEHAAQFHATWLDAAAAASRH
jgi:hypothetical protein